MNGHLTFTSFPICMILVVMFRDEIENRKIREKMTALALSFPALRKAVGKEVGISPFDPDMLDEWAAGPCSHGERYIAQFILAVWSPTEQWKSGKFDFMEAYQIWSDDHRRAFLAWAREPWWP